MVMKHLFDGSLAENADRIPLDLVPKNRVPSRCCIYKERAVIRERLIALFGYKLETDDDDYRALSSYLKEALENEKATLPLLTTISIGCSSCPKSHYAVSDACRGCFARPCASNCPKDAIVFENGKARILTDLCIKCGRCMERCPYHSIVHNSVPCEDSCPVGAIKQNDEGISEIDQEKCINCGMCMISCPFGAIAKRSALLKVGLMLKKKEKVTAIVAPAIEGQYNGNIEQIKNALLAVGFSSVIEVAEGAKITARKEAKELEERKRENKGFLLTSCCPAWFVLAEKHLPGLKSHISSTLSPMAYSAIRAKELYPDNKVVFIGPCLAKGYEAETKYKDKIDAVINFTELEAIFRAKEIDVSKMEYKREKNDYDDFRRFSFTGGVAESVLSCVENRDGYKVRRLSGIDKKTVREMALWTKLPPEEDLIEIMCCPMGCMNGPGTLKSPAEAKKLRDRYQKEREENE